MLSCSAPSTKVLRDICKHIGYPNGTSTLKNQLSYFDWKIDGILALLLIDCAEDSQYKSS